MLNIFEIQEAVADKVVAGLKLHLTKDEKDKVVGRGTESAEAFELNLQATSFLNMGTRQGHLHAIRLYEEAIEIDPNYAAAYLGIANNSMLLYRSYVREASRLVRAEQTIAEAMRLRPNFAGAYSMLGILHAHRHQEEEAIIAAKKAVELEPANPWGYFHLGFVYNELGRSRESADAYEATLRLNPEELISHFNLALQYHMLGEFGQRRVAARRALPYYEKYVRRHPDDQGKRTFYSILLFFAGQLDECKRETEAIVALPGLDGFTCYNCGCTFIFLNELPRALELLEKAVDLGFAGKKLFLHDPDLAPLRTLPGWDRILTKVEAAEQKEQTANV